MRKFTLMIIMCLCMALPVSADTLSDQIETVKSDLSSYVTTSVQNTVLENYNYGYVYTTVNEDIVFAKTDPDDDNCDTGYLYLNEEKYEADDKLFAGEWREITEAMLYATPGTTLVTDDDDELSDPYDLDNLTKNGEIGGKRYYTLIAGIASDGNGLSFLTRSKTGYLSNPTIFGASAYTSEDYTSGVFVGLEDAYTEIMPPYTNVRAFEQVYAGEEDSDEED